MSKRFFARNYPMEMYQPTCSFSCKSNSFSYERPRFETEALGSTEMVYHRVIFQPVIWLFPGLVQEGHVSQSLNHLIIGVWTEICFRVRITRPFPRKARTMRCKLSVKRGKQQKNVITLFANSFLGSIEPLFKTPSRRQDPQ